MALSSTADTIRLWVNHLVHTNVSRDRGQCPKCGGFNTFGLTRLEDAYIFQCFKNSCNLRGFLPITSSVDDISRLSKEYTHKFKQTGATDDTSKYELPLHLISGVASTDAAKWLSDNNALDAYTKGKYSLYTDLREERICIPLYNHYGMLVNLGGRAYNKSKYKFKLYNRTIIPPFVVGTGDTIVIVEDFASAASVTRIGAVGYALLGTNFNSEFQLPYIQQIHNVKEIVVALDKDAIKKSLDICRLLGYYYLSVRVVPLERDLKYISDVQELSNIIKL